MNQNEPIDVTEERDVTEQVDQFNSEQPGLVIPEPSPMYPGDDIAFPSMDTRTYLIARSAINWDDMLTAEDTLRDNQFQVRQILKEIMFAGNKPDNQSIQLAFEHVYPFIKEFGFDPTEGYNTMYPDATDYDKAIMYCIDANELLHVILREIAVYKTAKKYEEEKSNES